MRKRWLYIFMSLLLVLMQTIYASEQHKTADDNQQKTAHANDNAIEISPEGQQLAGIKTAILQPKRLPIYISAPGEVIPNQDLSAIVAPRISAQVIQRLVKVGDHVEPGQALVRLSSVEMAKAQSNLLLSQKEWLRVNALGKQAVSAKRYNTVEASYQQSFSRLLAYGMTRKQINAFLKSDDLNKANGEFALLAPRAGTIFYANFTEGEMIAPGKILYKIVDESSLWVDAKLANGDSANIQRGNPAIIQTSRHNLSATVLQVHHQLDATTRTRVVRLTMANPKDLLHPGEFVTCLIKTGETQPVLAVHVTTLVRMPDGEHAIYVAEKANHFEAHEVKITRKIGQWRVIEGIKPGLHIVTKGAFFVHSETLKNGFSTHNH